MVNWKTRAGGTCISLMTVVILTWVTLCKPITEFHVEGETFPDISTKVSFDNPSDIPQKLRIKHIIHNESWAVMLCDVKPEPNRLSTSNTPKLTASGEYGRTGTIHEMEAFHLQKVKFSDKIRPINIIDMINGCIYSCIVLHAMFHVVFLLIGSIFVFLNYCFDSPKSKKCLQLFSMRKKSVDLTDIFYIIDRYLVPDSVKSCHSKSMFNFVLALIIIIPYCIGLYCCFREESKKFCFTLAKSFTMKVQQWLFSGIVNEKFIAGLSQMLMLASKLYTLKALITIDQFSCGFIIITNTEKILDVFEASWKCGIYSIDTETGIILCLCCSATTGLLPNVYPTTRCSLFARIAEFCKLFCLKPLLCCLLCHLQFLLFSILFFVIDMTIKYLVHFICKKLEAIPGKSHLYPDIRSLTLTLFTPVGTLVVSGLKTYNLEYHELRSIVTKHSQIPSKLLCFVVGKKKLDHNCSLDLRKNSVVNVYVRGCGGADNVDDNESDIQVCAVCDSKSSIKYYPMNGWSATKIKAAQSLTSKPLSTENDKICRKCERAAARKVTNPDHIPNKKQRVSTELCFLNRNDNCDNEATLTLTLKNIPQFLEFFEIDDENLDLNNVNPSLCYDHYWK